MKQKKRAYPQNDRKGLAEFERCRHLGTTPKKRWRAREADERKRAYRKRSARLCYTKPPDERERGVHPTHDEQKWCAAKRAPTRREWYAGWPNPTIGAASPRPDE